MSTAEPFFENTLSAVLPLDGPWSFSLAGQDWLTIPVPSAWEAHVRDKRPDGPAHYRREVELPPEWLDGRRVLFEADAVSYHTTVRVNGRPAGVHVGLWSPFQFDISDFVWPGQNTLELEVWKPGDRYPLRETLSGFLPDVATAFGGPWQSLRLRALDFALADVLVQARPTGVVVRGRVAWLRPRVGQDLPGLLVRAELAGEAATIVTAEPAGEFALTLPAAGLTRWRPDAPALHTVRLSVLADDQVVARAERRIGLREVHVSAGAAWLDERPLHLRGVLDWGWHPDLIAPAPPRERVERQFGQARSLGFNLVKLCLFVPDEATFDAADEAGMLLWLELPMWLPRVTPALRALALAEYAALLRRLHHHPSIVVVSLGCELNAEADVDFLGALDGLARSWLPNVLHCDNSGSAEAYGGVATALSDFYDYHFYTDPHFFQNLVDHFDRGYRPPKPWLYGEFCDADTGRDFGALQAEPWWLTDPVRLERDDYLYLRDYRRRLAAAEIADGAAALAQAARKQATAVRKYICELTRAHDATGGYVITGWADTPIATSGMIDDQGALKFEPAHWQQFNADGVLLLDRERRRRWLGGDRPAYRDPYTFWAGETAELHLLFSNGLAAAEGARLRWTLAATGGQVIASGEATTPPLPAGRVTEAAIIRPGLPAAYHSPVELCLSVELSLAAQDTRTVSNTWQLWAVPRPALPHRLPVYGALRHAHGFERLDRQIEVFEAEAAPGAPFVADSLSPQVLTAARAGGRGLVWLRQQDAPYLREMPFWREAIHAFAPHPLWQRVPQPGYADLRFFSLATDWAIDLAALAAHLGSEATSAPVWRRFDARQLTWAEYVVDVRCGAGRLLVTSLRLQGGLGRQPASFDASPMGAWLLASLLATLPDETR